MTNFLYKRIVNPFKANAGGSKYKYQVFFEIGINKIGNNTDYYCSIWGVHGPLASGNCMGNCGQNIDDFVNDSNIVYNKGWDKNLYEKFIQFWKDNHLKTVKEDSDYYHKLVETAEMFPESTSSHYPWF